MRTADGYIINKCLNGDKAAFGLLVDKYKEGVYALAYSKLGNFHDAEDVAQEVFIKAYRKLHTLKHYDSFHAWLYATTSNLCKDWIRARARRPDGEYIEDEDPKTLEILSIENYRGKATQRSLRESLEEALESLPEMHRQVLTLYYLAGMSGKEIAGFLGIAPMTAWRRLSRARSQLKKEMAAMMDAAFEEKRLPEGFTLRIVEAIKRIKIQPVPRAAGLPWGISAAAGVFITVLSFNPHIDLTNSSDACVGSPRSVDAQVLKAGEIPVDIFKITNVTAISNRQGDGKSGELKRANLQNILLMAPQAGDTWTEKADMPTARGWLSTSAVNGRIYAIGGYFNGVTLSAVEEYNPVTDKWTKKADMPTARFGLATSVVDNKIYAIGGAVRFTGAIGLSVVEEYDPVTDKWTRKADMPTARYQLSASAVNGRIYAIGGYSRGEEFSTVEEYNPLTDKWTRKADMPTARDSFGTGVVNGRIYAIGGDPILSTVEEYDPATDIWTSKADMPTARFSLSICALKGKIYAIGGSPGGGVILTTVEEYDPAKDIWTKKTDIPTARAVFSTSVVEGRIYAIGGRDEGNINEISTVEEYKPEVWPFSTSSHSKLPAKWGEIK